MATTTFNPYDKGVIPFGGGASYITLSNGNLTAVTNSATNFFGSVRSIGFLTTGKWYWEFTIASTGNPCWLGIANQTLKVTGESPAGTTNTTVISVGGQIRVANVVQSNVGVIPAGQTIAIAYDADASLVWYRPNAASGNWNNSGTANPATGVGGYSTTAAGLTPGARAFPFIGFNNVGVVGQGATANFGATAFVGTVPGGFTGAVNQVNTTWSTTDKAATITLSGSNLTAASSGGSVSSVRSVDRVNTGKWYWEVTCTTFGFIGNGIGIATANVGLTQQVTGGTSNPTSIVVAQNGAIYSNSSTTGVSIGSIANGTVLCIALDLVSGLIWFRQGAAGNWNGNAGYAPGGTGGITVQTGPSFVYYPFVEYGVSGYTTTANFGDSAFTGAVPTDFISGFPTWITPPLYDVVTQMSVEQYYTAIPLMQLTQMSVEQWAAVSVTSPYFTVTQIALEEWASATLGPLVTPVTGKPMITMVM